MMQLRLLLVALLMITAGQLSAQKKKSKKGKAKTEKPEKAGWKVEEARGPHKTANFTVKKGTWMNLDVSPDGSTLAFDLLGDIYSLPITGGKAKLLAGGLPYEVQPRFSPDGNKIMFTSDRGGGDNIWVMDQDGKNAKQVTKESFRLLNNGCWSPDGQYFVARKHFTSGRSLGAGEMWMYHITGGGGLQLTKRKNDQQDAGEPCISPDGRYVYFSEDMAGGGYFKYNKNPHEQIYIIRRYDLETGDLDNVVTGPGGAARPQISPDGRLLAFVKRVRLKTVLYIHDLETGEEWPLFDRLNKDQQETWAIFGVYPNFDWMPDGKALVIWAEGGFWKVPLDGAEATEIPFEAEVDQVIQEAVQYPQEVAPETFTAKMIRQATTAPNGKLVVFNAAGYLWKKSMPDGMPERLTDRDEFEFQPSFSPDGGRLLYTTWSDEETGAVRMLDLNTGTNKKLTTEKGYYHDPVFSPKGDHILWRKGPGTMELGYNYGKNTGLYLADRYGKEPRLLTKAGFHPYFHNDRVYFQSRGGGNKVFKSVDMNGGDERTHLSSKYATGFIPSPDFKWVAFTELFNVYVAAFPKTGQKVNLSSNTRNYPVFRATKDAGTSVHWSADGKQLHWMLGQEYFSRDLEDCFAFLEGAPEKLPPVDSSGIPLDLVLKSDIPNGLTAFTNARIITMNGDEVIEKGTILVENNRIKAIGTADQVSVPDNAYVMDASGKTIMPGIIDVHAHLRNSWNGISPQQQWSYFASLAYGVTTTHDPSSSTEMVFSQSEAVKAGHMIGPRIYSTGTILYGAEGDFKAVVNSLDDARSHLRRMKAVGAFSVKSYNQPRREQRQQVIQAARELEMMVYPEGGSFFYHNLSMVLDGHTGVEHCVPVAPVYEDVVKLWGNSKTGYTPTLIVGYGGIWGENYWYQKTRVWENEKLLKFYPRRVLDARSIRRMMIPDEDFGHIRNAEACKAIADGGSKVQLGAHGQLHGLGAHWELWNIHQGGFSNMEALRAATLWGAQYIGMDKDIGSLEAGKLADLIVLDKNPLDDIRNSESVSYTMINGRLYNAETLNEIGNREQERKPFYWESSRSSSAFPWHEVTRSFMAPNCGCMGVH